MSLKVLKFRLLVLNSLLSLNIPQLIPISICVRYCRKRTSEWINVFRGFQARYLGSHITSSGTQLQEKIKYSLVVMVRALNSLQLTNIYVQFEKFLLCSTKVTPKIKDESFDFLCASEWFHSQEPPQFISHPKHACLWADIQPTARCSYYYTYNRVNSSIKWITIVRNIRRQLSDFKQHIIKTIPKTTTLVETY